jgi:hypothetical protein
MVQSGIGPSKSILRVKDGNIYGWSGSQNLSSSAVVLLDYNNPSYFYLTRVNLGFDWSNQGPAEVLSYTIEVDGTGLFIEKTVLTDLNLGFQPKQIEFVIPPNARVRVMATQSANNGAVSCILTGFRL